MNAKSAAATRKRIAVDFAEAGSLAAPWPWPFFSAGFATAAGLACGATAGDLGGGGGQVTAPSLITVRPRMASSSKLTSITPSFFLQRSSAKRSRLFEYSVELCLANRL